MTNQTATIDSPLELRHLDGCIADILTDAANVDLRRSNIGTHVIVDRFEFAQQRVRNRIEHEVETEVTVRKAAEMMAEPLKDLIPENRFFSLDAETAQKIVERHLIDVINDNQP